MVNSPEMQIRLLSFMLTFKTDELFRNFMMVDKDIYKQTVNHPIALAIYKVFQKYYAANRTLPSRNMYNAYKHDVDTYANLKSSLKSEKAKIQAFENLLWEPIPKGDKPELKRRFLEFAVLNASAQISLEETAGYSHLEDSDSVIDLYKKTSRDRVNFLSRLEYLLDDHDTGQAGFVMNENYKWTPEVASSIPIISSICPSIRYYQNGMTTLLSGAKGGKTLVMLAEANALALDAGMDILLFDLENGLLKYRNRMYQNLIGVPRYAVEGNKMIDPQAIADIDPTIFRYDPHTRYEFGDIVWEYQYYYKFPQKRRGYNVDDRELIIRPVFYRCNSVKPEPIEDEWGWESMDWERVDIPVRLDDVIRPTDEAVRKEIKRRRLLGSGQVKVVNIGSPTTRNLEEVVHRVINDTDGMYDGFYEGLLTRGFFLDWVSLMKAEGRFQHISERTNDIYYGLKEIRDEHHCTQLVIEGTTNAGLFTSYNPNLREIKAKGSSETDYNVNAKIGIFASDLEDQRNVRRFRVIVDRDNAKTKNFMKVDFRNQQLKSITAAQHKAIVPEAWADAGTGDDDENLTEA
jgi:hypothetical protein